CVLLAIQSRYEYCNSFSDVPSTSSRSNLSSVTWRTSYAALLFSTRRRRSRTFFFFQAEDGIRDGHVTGVQTCALPILLEEATAFKQPFRNVQANFQVPNKTPDVLLVGLRAPLFGGDVGGQIRIDFNSTVRYELNLTASQDRKSVV